MFQFKLNTVDTNSYSQEICTYLFILRQDLMLSRLVSKEKVQGIVYHPAKPTNSDKALAGQAGYHVRMETSPRVKIEIVILQSERVHQPLLRVGTCILTRQQRQEA